MAVKIRLMRMGKKKQPTYRVVVADSRSPRDGRFIELIGRYDPRQEPSVVEIDNDRAVDWLQKGAQPSAQVRKLLEISGAWSRFKIASGDIHTVDTPPAKPAAPAPAEMPQEIHVVGGDAPTDDEPTPAAEAGVDTDVDVAPEPVAEVEDTVTMAEEVSADEDEETS